jgi:hypothetical protein
MKKNYIFAFLTIRSCPRVLEEHVQKVDRMDWERKFFFPGAQQGKKLPILFKKTSFLS